MKGRMAWILVATTIMAVPDVGLEAQRRPPRGGGGLGEVDRAAARALRLGDEIELTDAQREGLRALRADALQALETQEREALQIRQELRARSRRAEADPETTREDLRALRDEARDRREAFRERESQALAAIRERYEDILSVEQRLELRERGREGRARAGRGRAMRRGVEGGREGFRGRRGPARDRVGPARFGRGGVWRGGTFGA